MLKKIALALLVSMSLNTRVVAHENVQAVINAAPLADQALKIAKESMGLAQSAFGSLREQISIKNFNKLMDKHGPMVIIGGIGGFFFALAILQEWCDNNLFISQWSIGRVKELIETVTNANLSLEKRDDACWRLRKYTRCYGEKFKNIHSFLTGPDGLINSYSSYRKNLFAKNQFDSMSKHLQTELDTLSSDTLVVSATA